MDMATAVPASDFPPYTPEKNAALTQWFEY
jgi:hypothetical protein